MLNTRFDYSSKSTIVGRLKKSVPLLYNRPLMFKHIAELFYRGKKFALRTLPKLSLDHIVLTSYSDNRIEEKGNDDVLGTADN